MNANTKKWINRSGIISVGVGIILIVIAGGDVESALALGGRIATFVGVAMGVVREMLG